MEGIEFIINNLKIYHSKESDLLSVYLEIFTGNRIELSLNNKNKILSTLVEKIEECLNCENYFNTNKQQLSRMKTIIYKNVEYKLNLSEHKHYYFHELVILYDNIITLNINSEFNISFK